MSRKPSEFSDKEIISIFKKHEGYLLTSGYVSRELCGEYVHGFGAILMRLFNKNVLLRTYDKGAYRYGLVEHVEVRQAIAANAKVAEAPEGLRDRLAIAALPALIELFMGDSRYNLRAIGEMAYAAADATLIGRDLRSKNSEVPE